MINYKSIAKGAVIGAFAGMVAILYRLLIAQSKQFMLLLVDQTHTLGFIFPLIGILLIGAIISGVFLNWEKLSGGSGIPQLKAELYDKIDPNPLKVIIAKFVGGATAVICGLSVGREGPSIQLGAMAGKLFKTNDKKKTKNFISCGAAAGLAAAFNAPLAGVLFAFEELPPHNVLPMNELLPLLASVFTADFISKLFFGNSTVFHIQNTCPIELSHYWILLLFGIFTGVMGVVYNRTLIIVNNIYSKISKIKIFIPFIVAGLLFYMFPELLGPGHRIIDRMMIEDFTMVFLISLFVGKLIFSMISFGSGVAGGIFLPMLVMGAILGKLFGAYVIPLAGLDPNVANTLIIIGMAGFFSSIVRAPLTGIVLVYELTGYPELLPIIIVSLISVVVAEALKSSPVYEYLLRKNFKSE